MKINLLFLVVPLAIALCVYIVLDLQGQSEQTFFGTAETEPVVLNMQEDVLALKVFVETGMQVQKGDTLAVMYRSDIELEALANESAYRLQHLTHQTRLELLARERETIKAQANAAVSELRAKLRQIALEDSLAHSLKTAVFPGLSVDRSASASRLDALREEIAQVERVTLEKLRELDAQAAVSGKISAEKQRETQLRQRFEKSARESLVLIAPVDGYVDQLQIAPQMPVPAFQDMMRIYPLRPTKIVGFIHESTEILFHIGDPVSLSSGVRATPSIQGKIVAVSPKLVELPLRLRKFAEVRAWGREVMIQIPPDNPYYIGERITISLQSASK